MHAFCHNLPKKEKKKRKDQRPAPVPDLSPHTHTNELPHTTTTTELSYYPLSCISDRRFPPWTTQEKGHLEGTGRPRRGVGQKELAFLLFLVPRQRFPLLFFFSFFLFGDQQNEGRFGRETCFPR
jgi:hypothetical protein